MIRSVLALLALVTLVAWTAWDPTVAAATEEPVVAAQIGAAHIGAAPAVDARVDPPGPRLPKWLRPRRLLAALPTFFLIGGLWYAAKTRRRSWVAVICAAAAISATALAVAPVINTNPRPLRLQPAPDAQEYAEGAFQLATGNGYVTTFPNGEPRPPRYPPGFSVALAPFAAFGGYPAGVQQGAKFYAVLYLLAAIGLAWTLGGPIAATLAAGLIGTSPFAERYASMVMSDAFVAALTLLLVLLVHQPSWPRIALAGTIVGALVTTRLNAATVAAALLLSIPTHARRLQVVTFAAPAIVALAIFQWQTFGSPLRTGYDDVLRDLNVRTFDWSYAVTVPDQRDGSGVLADALDGALMRWACPCREDDSLQAPLSNTVFYAAVLLGLYWVFAPPLLTVPGLLYLWTHRRDAAPKFALSLTIISVLFHVFFLAHAARYMAGPASLLAIFTAVGAARWAESRIARALEVDAPSAAAPTAAAGIPAPVARS